MDYALKKTPLSFTKDISDTVSQQPVDLDFTLPDYCADIEKILKCTLEPKVYTRSLSAGQLRIDGASVVRILYCDGSKKALRCCEQTVPFSTTIPVNDELCEHLILTKVKAEYLNCRALTPRRLSVHGAFSLYTTIKEKCTAEICEESCDTDLQTKTLNAQICEVCDFLQEQFTVSESVTVNSRNSVEAIVRSEVCTELKNIDRKGDKLIAEAEATLKMLYISDAATGEVDQFVYVFPFKQTLETKSQNCDVTDLRLDVQSYELMLSSRMVSEEPVVNLELKMCATLLTYNNREVRYISDAYSMANDVSLLSEQTVEPCDVYPLHTSSVIKSSINLGDRKVAKILDIFCEEPSVTSEVKENKLIVSGKINVCVLASCEDDELISIERRIDVETTETLDKSYAYINGLSLSVNSISYRIKEDNDLSLRLDVGLCAVLCNLFTIDQITAVEKAGQKSSDKTPLTLYYADKGEEIWEIAKRYSAPVSLLREENNIMEDELPESRMLLILNM